MAENNGEKPRRNGIRAKRSGVSKAWREISVSMANEIVKKRKKNGGVSMKISRKNEKLASENSGENGGSEIMAGVSEAAAA
jgi:hypothetical protein